MLIRQVALVPEDVDVDAGEVVRVAAALQKQVTRDFAPIWEIPGTVDGFAKLEDVPLGYWPVLLVRDVADAAGVHLDDNGQPYALVEVGDSWSLTASHETLEMLADPFGNRLVGSASPKPGQGRVEILVEVCDPPEDADFAYQVNGVLVSDFYTPHYFDPIKASGVRYSYTGAIDEPLRVLDGGYISYEEPVSQHWFQIRMFPDEISSQVPHVVDLSAQTAFLKIKATTSLRAAVDRVTKPPQYLAGLTASAVSETQQGADLSAQAQVSRAQNLRKELMRLMNPKDGSG